MMSDVSVGQQKGLDKWENAKTAYSASVDSHGIKPTDLALLFLTLRAHYLTSIMIMITIKVHDPSL